MADCVFCGGERTIKSPIERLVVGGHAVMVFEPLGPVVPGHLLVVPNMHVEHAAENPRVSAVTMHAASLVSRRYESANILTSIGAPATQTVKHLHLHVVPRSEDDGVWLPWTPVREVLRKVGNHLGVTDYPRNKGSW